MSALTLVPVSILDSAEVSQLVKFVNQNYQSPVPLSQSSVQSGKYRFYWAVAGGTRVGVTAYQEITPFLVETVKTVIDAIHRGQGLGAKISEEIENEIRKGGYKKIKTTIYIDNLPMIFIKLKQGYLFEGFHPNHEKPGWHEYSLGKVLD